jgi:hypothetical protein
MARGPGTVFWIGKQERNLCLSSVLCAGIGLCWAVSLSLSWKMGHCGRPGCQRLEARAMPPNMGLFHWFVHGLVVGSSPPSGGRGPRASIYGLQATVSFLPAKVLNTEVAQVPGAHAHALRRRWPAGSATHRRAMAHDSGDGPGAVPEGTPLAAPSRGGSHLPECSC